jgi:ABC-type antimicrobial peptide transport system permease subunit
MPVETDVGMTFEPIEIQEPTYAEVEIEIAEIEIAEIELELEIETEIEATVEETVEDVAVEEDIKEPEQQQEETSTEEAEPENEIEVSENEKEEPEQIEDTKEEQEEPQQEQKESSKEKAVKKIMKKMNDKKKYDDINQTKTLVVMQVLGNTKTFFQDQQQLNDRIGFFSNVVLPDTVINDNDMASYFLFVGSDGLMNEMIDSQWQQK